MGKRFSIDPQGACSRLPENDREWSDWVAHLVESGAKMHAEACLKRISDPGLRDRMREVVARTHDRWNPDQRGGRS